MIFYSRKNSSFKNEVFERSKLLSFFRDDVNVIPPEVKGEYNVIG